MPEQAFQSPSMPLALKEIASRSCSTHRQGQPTGERDSRLHHHTRTGPQVPSSPVEHTKTSSAAWQRYREGDGCNYLGGGLGLADLDDGVGNLDAHLIVLVVGRSALVLLVGATTHAAAVIEDGDHGGAARLCAAQPQASTTSKAALERSLSAPTHVAIDAQDNDIVDTSRKLSPAPVLRFTWSAIFTGPRLPPSMTPHRMLLCIRLIPPGCPPHNLPRHGPLLGWDRGTP